MFTFILLNAIILVNISFIDAIPDFNFFSLSPLPFNTSSNDPIPVFLDLSLFSDEDCVEGFSTALLILIQTPSILPQMKLC